MLRIHLVPKSIHVEHNLRRFAMDLAHFNHLLPISGTLLQHSCKRPIKKPRGLLVKRAFERAQIRPAVCTAIIPIGISRGEIETG
jgi:hypothetical protein